MTINLCFHGIGACAVEREPGEARYWVDETFFLSVLDCVADRRDVELSFDDGNRSDVEVALPAVRERGLTATFFVLAGRLGDPASLAPRDLQLLRDSGMRLGSHGWHHVPWRGLTGAERQRELVDARTALEAASGVTITDAALPLGRYDRRVLHSLRAADYQRVFTSDRFPAREGSWLQPRYSVTAQDTLESLREILTTTPGPREARQLLTSCVKRLR